MPRREIKIYRIIQLNKGEIERMIVLLLRNGKTVNVSKGIVEEAKYDERKRFLRVIEGKLYPDDISIPLADGSFATFDEGTFFL